MGFKVVYSNSHGGFCLSRVAAIWLAGQGCDEAIRWLAASDENDSFFAHGMERHDPLLTKCVEVLGFEVAEGMYSTLCITEVEDLYMIDEYDGSETVVEPKDIKWISAKS